MNRTLLLGTLVALAGLGVVFVPGLGAGFHLTYGSVLVVGALALAAGVTLGRRRFSTDRNTAEVPMVESLPDHPVPGDEFDADLAAISPRRDRANDAARAEIRARLEAAALAVLAREGHPREVGRGLLDSGEWTDDPVAAAFFAVEPIGRDDDESLGERLRSSVAGGYSFDTRAKRAAYAIADRAGVDRAGDARGDDDEPAATDGDDRERGVSSETRSETPAPTTTSEGVADD